MIDYAENPDKTTDPKYLDDDLRRVLAYTENDRKTDRRMFVSTVNCSKQDPYGDMMATKHRFGKLGGNVAYHAFQSFKTGEITPEEAHAIGRETAHRMWGGEYQIVVTTHLNTENVHNHIVLNSVFFKTGRKFENHVSDHYKLREISDAIHDRLLANHSKPELYCIIYPQRKRTPLLEFERAYREARRMDGLQLIFAIFLEMLKVCTGNNLAENKVLPLSPMLREEVRKLDQYIEDHQFLCDCHIDTAEELSVFRASTSTKIAGLETQREQIRNRIRRAPETEKAHLKEQAKAITSQITPLRKQIKIADRIMERSVRMRQLLDQERQLETNEITKERNIER